MEFYKNLYIGASIKNPARAKWKLNHNAGQISLFVIALCSGTDQLEIYHSAFLQQKYYKKYPPFIIGICESYDEAVQIVVGIADKAYKDGKGNINKYLFHENE